MEQPTKPPAPLASETGLETLTAMTGGADPGTPKQLLRGMAQLELNLVEAKNAEDKAYWQHRWRLNEHYIAEKATGATDKTATANAEKHSQSMKEEHLARVGERRMLEAALSMTKRWHTSMEKQNAATDNG